MQTLWARAAHIRCTCNCTSCHSPTAFLNRRVTSTAFRKPIRFRDVFTVFYSSILTSAAIADIRRKEVAKAELEKSIKEARDDLKALEEQQQARLAAIALRDDDTVQPPCASQGSWHDVFQWSKWMMAERKRMGFQDLKGPPLTLLEELSTSEIEELMHDRYISRLSSANGEHLWCSTDGYGRISIKKVKTLEWSIRKLVHRLLLSTLEETGAWREAQSEGAHVDSQLPPEATLSSDKLREKIEDCEKRLCFLKRHTSNKEYWYRFSSPDSPVYSRRSTRVQRADSLNIELDRIFKSFRRTNEGKDTLVQEICYALLSSYTHPDVHTYNILILHLFNLKQMDDVAAVITSLQESHTRPNEVTLSAMLNFYTATGNREGFTKLLQQMKGRQGGLFLAHPATIISTAFPGRYKRKISRVAMQPVKISEEEEEFYYERGGYKFRPSGLQPLADYHSTRKIVQGARMTLLNQTVYGALIHGALQFLGSGQAMKYYRQMVNDGWETSRRLLLEILHYCSNKDEWEDGCTVWQELCNLPEGPDRTSIVWMLKLCRSRGEHVRFGEVLEYCVRRNLIPPTVWQFPRLATDVGIISVAKLMRAADILFSAKLLSPPFTLALDFLDRSLEALGYRIANTAIEVAATNFNACPSINSDTGFNVYLRIRELHRESPAACEDKARRKVLQGLKEKNQRVTEGQDDDVEELPFEDCAILSCGCCDANFTSVDDLHAHLIMCSSPNVTNASSDIVLERSAPTSKVMESVEPSLGREASPAPRQQLASFNASEGMGVRNPLPNPEQHLASFCATEGVQAGLSEHNSPKSMAESPSNHVTTVNTDFTRVMATSDDRAANIEQLKMNESTTISHVNSPPAELANIEMRRLSAQYCAADRKRRLLAVNRPFSRAETRRSPPPESPQEGSKIRVILDYDIGSQLEEDQSVTESDDTQQILHHQLRRVNTDAPLSDLPLVRDVLSSDRPKPRDGSAPRGGLVIKRYPLGSPGEPLEAKA